MNSNDIDLTKVNAVRPLSPGDFKLPDTGSAKTTNPDSLNLIPDTEAGDGTLDATDVLTLQAALNLLRDARVDAGSKSAAVATEAKLKLVQLIGYVAGFLDARKINQSVELNPGFDELMGKIAQPSAEVCLDQLDASLVELISTPNTRGWRNKVANVLDYLSAADTALGVGYGLAAGAALFAPTP